jgi:hypothetical protein
MEDLVCQGNLLVENILERLHECFLEEVEEAYLMLRDHVGNPPHHVLCVWNIRGMNMLVLKFT